MYIFLDESKAITGKNGKFVFGGIATSLNPSTIDKLYFSYLKEYGIKEKGGEIKSYDESYKYYTTYFFEYLKNSKYFKNIEFLGLYATNYYESGPNYYYILRELLAYLLEENTIKGNTLDKINIIADHLKLNYSQNDIKRLLNEDILLSKFKKQYNINKFDFIFSNSKRYGGIKFSDFTAGLLRKKYILEESELPCGFVECFVGKDIKIIKLQ